MTIARAIKLLQMEYERAKQLEFVKNQLAWALYQVWKMVESADQPKITTRTEIALEKMGRAVHRGE